MYTIYHNPRCKKSRAGLQYVNEKKMEHQVREYLKEPLTEEELGRLLMKLHKKPFEMISRHFFCFSVAVRISRSFARVVAT